MLGSYKRNPKLADSVYAEAPKDATHYNKLKPCKFLRKVGLGNAYFSASRSWVEYYNTSQGKLDLAAAEPLYIPTIRGKPGTVLSGDEWDSSLSIFPKEILMQIAESKAQQVAPKYQTQQELLDENVSLENQVEKLQLRINKKQAFWEANARKITAWAVILDT
jgi:hypothetical protein